jgi:predicted amidohydrolase
MLGNSYCIAHPAVTLWSILHWCLVQAWGHSTFIGPFAEILATCEHGEGIVYADMDLSQVSEHQAGLGCRNSA